MRLAVAALAMAGLATPALADWQYTKWGMSPDEVITAANGTAQKVKDEKDKRVRKLPRLATGKASEGKVNFDVEFFFLDNKLSLIRYQPTGTMDCAGEEQFFLEHFGPAEPTEKVTEFKERNLVLLKTRTRTWKMPSGDSLYYNVIRIERPDLPNLQVRPMCVAVIEPIPPLAPAK